MHNPSAKEIMATQRPTLSPSACVFDAIRVLLSRRISGAPVVDAQGRYFGVFSEKCCMRVINAMAQSLSRSGRPLLDAPCAREFMVKKLITLSPDTDVYEAIGYLLQNRISGAPVIDPPGTFRGVFSEKTSMSVLLGGAFEQLPTTQVRAFMNTDFARTISASTGLLTVVQTFLDTSYRRLPVLGDGLLLGQVSRQDVLRAVHRWLPRQPTGSGHSERTKRSATKSAPEDSLRWSSAEVSAFMDRQARTIDERTDLLSIAQIFLNTPYRRLPVLRNGKLVGQIDRRDLLEAAQELTMLPTHRTPASLFISAVAERDDSLFA